MRRGSVSVHRFGLCHLLFIVPILTACGCGGSTGTISGKVTYQGKTLPGGYVNFLAGENSDTVKTSTIGKDGSYSVSGVPLGPVKITVQGIEAPVQAGKASTPKGMEVPHSDRQPVYVPPKYTTTEESGLVYTVKPGSQTHPIDLK